MPKIDGTLLTLLVGGMLAGIGGIWRELRQGFTAQSEVKSLRDDVVELRDVVDRLTSRLDAAYVQIHELKCDKAQSDARNAVLEETLAVLRQEVKELRAQNRELRTQNEKLSAELTCGREMGGSG